MAIPMETKQFDNLKTQACNILSAAKILLRALGLVNYLVSLCSVSNLFRQGITYIALKPLKILFYKHGMLPKQTF